MGLAALCRQPHMKGLFMFLWLIGSIATMLTFLVLFGLLIWLPLLGASYVLRRLILLASGNKVMWFTRSEQVRHGLGLPLGDDWYDEDMAVRKKR